MKPKDFRDSRIEVPSDARRYEVDLVNGIYIPADYMDGDWFFINGDQIPESIAIKWR